MQDGYVYAHGKQWIGRYRKYSLTGELLGRPVVTLGPRRSMTKKEAEGKLRDIVAKHSVTHATGDGKSLLREFVESYYKPSRVEGRRAATQRSYTQALDYYILPQLGDIPLGEVQKPTLITFLNKLASRYSKTVVQQCRYHIKAIFDEALEAEWMYKNPARKLPMPDCKEPDQPYMENEEFLKLCDELPVYKDWLIVNVCRFGGLRTSEVFALRWKNWDGICFRPTDTVWNGIVQPRKLKRKSAKGPVAIPAGLRADIGKWKEICSDPSPDAIIFPNTEGGPMDPSNFIDRVIRPAAERAQISVAATFQVMRRTTATKQQQHGGVKSVQGQLRHSTVQTTFELYAQGVPADQQEMVDSDWEEVQKARRRPPQATGGQIGGQKEGKRVLRGR
jgi:integrase